MIWYKFHVGDYITHTLHLSDAEDLAYRRLLDLYYMSEKPIPNDIQAVCRKIRLDQDVVEPVLEEFFERTVDGWLNVRCEEEIRKYAKVVEINKVIAKKSATARHERALKKRASKGSGRTVDGALTKRERTDNLTDTETEIEKEEKNKHPSSTASTAFDEFWKTWPASKRKVGKVACEKKWTERKLDQVAKEILAHVRAMKQTEQWREGFEPSPITYLNQSRWHDGTPEGDSTNPAVFAGRRVL